MPLVKAFNSLALRTLKGIKERVGVRGKYKEKSSILIPSS